MGLLVTTEIKAIGTKAIAWGLAEVRSVLFADFDPGARANIMAVAQGNETVGDLLRRDLGTLNSLTERTAEGGFLLTIWLEACAAKVAAQKSQAQFFTDLVAKLNALPAVVQPDSEEAAGKIADAIHDSGAPTAAVAALAGELDGYIDKLAVHAEVLVKAKRLHDSLHSLQTGALPILRQVAAIGPASPLFAPLATSTLTMVDNAAGGIVAEVGGLGADTTVKAMAGGLAASLKDCALAATTAVGQIRAAASAAPPDQAGVTAGLAGFVAAVGTLRNRIRDDMSTLETEIDQRIGQMQPGQPLALDQLVAALNRLAENAADPELKAAANRAVQSLTVIWVDLSSIGRRHHDWQHVDSQLWLLELVFDQLGEGKDVGILFDWTGVTRRLESLGGAPKPEWAERIDGLAAKFVLVCPQPPAVPLGAGAAESFGSVVGEIRKVFREVDLNLKASCERLGAITAQLARL